MSGRFEVGDTALRGVHVLQRRQHVDERGWLERMYCTTDLAEVLDGRGIAQVNRTLTRIKATVRGMHFQVAPSAEAKIVSCLRGEVFDVAVDLRHDSPTFLEWHAEVLSEENSRSLFVPEGVAHGFQTMADDSELLYFHTAAYDPSAERGVQPLDPRLAITWPLAVAYLSDRDASHPLVDSTFTGVLV